MINYLISVKPNKVYSPDNTHCKNTYNASFVCETCHVSLAEKDSRPLKNVRKGHSKTVRR